MPALARRISSIHNGLKRLRRDAAWQAGLGVSELQQARGARILVYHGVCPEDPFLFNTLFVSTQVFETHLRLYTKYFNLISLEDFYLKKFSDQRFNVCLTFDDGFANNYRYVLPLLQKYKVPATFFVTAVRHFGDDILWNDSLSAACKYGPAGFSFRNSNFVKSKNGKYKDKATGNELATILRQADFQAKREMMELFKSFHKAHQQDYWLQMTASEIRALSDSPWATIGSHSYCHDDLAELNNAGLKDDLKKSKYFLENTIGKEIRSLAFPYGSYSLGVVDAARNTGFDQLLATDFLLPVHLNDQTVKGRLTINPFISAINQLYANVKGSYD